AARRGGADRRHRRIREATATTGCEGRTVSVSRLVGHAPDHEQLLLAPTRREQATRLELWRPRRHQRAQWSWNSLHDLRAQARLPEPLERRPAVDQRGMHQQQGSAGTKIGGGLGANPVEQRAAVEAGVPRTLGSAWWQPVGSAGDVRRVAGYQVELLAGERLQQITAPHVDP